jgi:hypothetical protein
MEHISCLGGAQSDFLQRLNIVQDTHDGAELCQAHVKMG